MTPKASDGIGIPVHYGVGSITATDNIGSLKSAAVFYKP